MGHSLLSPFRSNSTELTESGHPLSSPPSFFLPLPPRPSALFRLFSFNPHPTSPILPQGKKNEEFPKYSIHRLSQFSLLIFILPRALLNWRYIPKS
ncbi:hypothetical protein V6N11_002605 [Hibiscus sabdariffa]|uniref:Uncharacterized protein n=1 Tax=Hibiscus sabdariffa TaxID=183260 RepID=A0ABR2SAU3_9ROSI